MGEAAIPLRYVVSSVKLFITISSIEADTQPLEEDHVAETATPIEHTNQTKRKGLTSTYSVLLPPPTRSRFADDISARNKKHYEQSNKNSTSQKKPRRVPFVFRRCPCLSTTFDALSGFLACFRQGCVPQKNAAPDLIFLSGFAQLHQINFFLT